MFVSKQIREEKRKKEKEKKRKRGRKREIKKKSIKEEREKRKGKKGRKIKKSDGGRSSLIKAPTRNHFIPAISDPLVFRIRGADRHENFNFRQQTKRGTG